MNRNIRLEILERNWDSILVLHQHSGVEGVLLEKYKIFQDPLPKQTDKLTQSAGGNVARQRQTTTTFSGIAPS